MGNKKDNKLEANNKVKETKVTEETSHGKTEEELKEIAATLKTQLQHHQTMAIKAQGALEVILQMLPKEDNNGEES